MTEQVQFIAEARLKTLALSREAAGLIGEISDEPTIFQAVWRELIRSVEFFSKPYLRWASPT
ncbi:hypothetical protein QUA56_33160 [Microcoleus sp. N3A4]|uniref:hypothetical protein n=1 Tax=Microcoleus sp. N3A4 TaxID=3055379 RepID=UPI002FD676E0